MSADSDAATRAALAAAGVVAVKIAWPIFVRLLRWVAFKSGQAYGHWRAGRRRGNVAGR